MDSHKKNPQNAQFALLTEFCKNLESNHEFYVKRFKRFKNDLDHKNRIISQSAQEWIKREIEMMRAWYEVTENPVFLWKALAFCIEGELDFPEWITKYMHKSADKIMKAAHNYQKGDVKNIITDALNFKGSGSKNKFTEFKKIMERCSLISKVMRKRTSSDKRLEDIEEEVAYSLLPDDLKKDYLNDKELKRYENVKNRLKRNLRAWRLLYQKIPKDLNLG